MRGRVCRGRQRAIIRLALWTIKRRIFGSWQREEKRLSLIFPARVRSAVTRGAQQALDVVLFGSKGSLSPVAYFSILILT